MVGGIRPTAVFQIGGAGAVGTGSIRAWRGSPLSAGRVLSLAVRSRGIPDAGRDLPASLDRQGREILVGMPPRASW